MYCVKPFWSNEKCYNVYENVKYSSFKFWDKKNTERELSVA